MRTSNTTPPLTPPALSDAQIESDRRMEVLMDELLGQDDLCPELPPDFTARILANRPFAPWEVRHLRVWKVPAAVGAGLLGTGVAVSITPMFSLGPGTAFTMWADLLAVSVGRPASVALEAGPRLVEGLSLAMGSVSGSAGLLGASVLVSGVALGYLVRRAGTLTRPAGGTVTRPAGR